MKLKERDTKENLEKIITLMIKNQEQAVVNVIKVNLVVAVDNGAMPNKINPKVLKVFHAADNDLLWLRQDLGLHTTCILDIQVLSRLLGLPLDGLTHQWAGICNVHAPLALKRRLQLSDWQRRPLAALQLRYAAADAYFLLPIANALLHLASHLFPGQCTWACDITLLQLKMV